MSQPPSGPQDMTNIAQQVANDFVSEGMRSMFTGFLKGNTHDNDYDGNCAANPNAPTNSAASDTTKDDKILAAINNLAESLKEKTSAPPGPNTGSISTAPLLVNEDAMAKKIAAEVADGLKEAVVPFFKAQAGFMQKMLAKETSLPRQRLSFGSPEVTELDDSPKAAEETGLEEDAAA
ncbi:hypothetical protein EMIHUDRAFT_196692 [Emiliania huxleyi CCMP1516]|uniref:Uncharacterized protein n=2 Tax=Emiliania huxleyi TaxID=2903 RepID=A0A0D3J4J4_EMIH1|nr:hypothetical protein EMIHUDRAFT_196692 [Emiliania huxleyi CCMP1516]EOD18429.1 hypothetical protein EMIHUDRAFT_196692 [Emiliania huxleyi CCMP1516]|eukprot:XP_005770858.1 hypothetical protein EMIHUDRAFT_196692 [Emiliania huxleyi CCMP1516]